MTGSKREVSELGLEHQGSVHWPTLAPLPAPSSGCRSWAPLPRSGSPSQAAGALGELA